MTGTEPFIHRMDECMRVAGALSSMGRKWSVPVVMLLREQPRRFSELKRDADGISQRMLTRTLRHLERDGLVTRTVTPSIPPRVDYALSELGHSFAASIQGVGRWAFYHLGQIEAAQALYDTEA